MIKPHVKRVVPSDGIGPRYYGWWMWEDGPRVLVATTVRELAAKVRKYAVVEERN